MTVARRIALLGIAVFALCVTPLLLYILFGPADGNPVGLGLLMVAGTLLSGGMLAVAALTALVALLRS